MALARALKNAGHNVRCAKSGPDYIDTAFHQAATGKPCYNLDGWAMSPERISNLGSGDDLLVVEGAMGLFDAAADGRGASADIAKQLNLPVLLVVDCMSMGQSVAALVAGFVNHDPEVTVAGVILNRIGSSRHETILRSALAPLGTPILGAIHRHAQLARPSRHLGLVQASEDAGLEQYLDNAAQIVAKAVDIEAITKLAGKRPSSASPAQMTPLGQHIAIAKDAAFTFIYPHMLADWTAQGAKISYFSPLADQAPAAEADAIFLPGGYPELFAAKLTRAGQFRKSMRDAANRKTTIYGECGGYMVLGHSITDKTNVPHPMLGLLDLETSFAQPKLHLGYKTLTRAQNSLSGAFKAHEFHYATTLHAKGAPLFDVLESDGQTRGKIGLVSGTVSGSFAHIIDRA